MKFSIALYGSLKDSAGYTWKALHDVDTNRLEEINFKLTKQYEDGRKIPAEAIFGGYYIDFNLDRFYAFRFMNGGYDNRGRAGVVVTNWAVSRYSEVAGKDIKALFEHLTFMQLPANGNMDIVLLPAPAENNSLLMGETGKELTGEEARRILQLPRGRSSGNILVELCIDEKKQWCKVQFEKNGEKSMPPEKVSSHKRCAPPRNRKEKEPHKNPSSFRLPVACIIVLCAACAVLMLFPKPENASPSAQESPGSLVPPQKNPGPVTVPPKPPNQNLRLMAKEFSLLLPGGAWRRENGSFIRKMELAYPWGHLKIDNSQFIWCFNGNISFKEVRGADECKVLSSGDIIGRIEWHETAKSFTFSRSQGLPGSEVTEEKFFLYHDELKKDSAELTLCSTSVSLKLFPNGKDAVPSKKRSKAQWWPSLFGEK